MERTLININIKDFPWELHSILENAKIYDSCCFSGAKVYYVEKGKGYFLKNAPKGSLKAETEMTAYFAEKGLAPTVLQYISSDSDWMLTERVAGEDCIFHKYMESPERLCDLLAELLYKLHNTDYSDCPVKNRVEAYLNTVEENYKKGVFDNSYLMPNMAGLDKDAAYNYIQQRKHLLRSDTLIHGDYCLPNIILDDFKFSGFVDLGGAGVGDKHIDLYWATWTFKYNFKTDKYRHRFLDAYGREAVQEDIIDLVSVIETFG